ncbi:DUF2953 domain-containing protein [Aliiroseovarius sp. S2029]|uniref:DUF2953 domain-containing protein n=1 Tax=Aliiroseovarius sp. S2029 TaxID=2936988 RepID=UPI0020C0D456|nr:DUF2953 domain-containing protein [Aliiroseovarius sp. S2029]MCK8483931.1 DUF2953 domain-containing protein [Aliiroseovarius sp. S2029]
MATAFVIVLWTLAALLALLLAAILMPLRLELSATREECWHVFLALRPFGRFGPRIPLRRNVSKREEKPEKVPGKARSRRHGRRDPRRLVPAAIRLLSDVLGSVRVHKASVDLRFGCEDPADTGQTFGLMAPLIYGTAGMSRFDVRVEPVFDRALLAGRAALDISIIPARLVPPFIRFGWSAFGPRR